MAWEVRFTDEFTTWFNALDDKAAAAAARALTMLQLEGPALGRPYVDSVNGSRHSNLKELRAQAQGRPLRMFFAFDPTRSAIMLVGGDKTGDDRFYARMIGEADNLYASHLATL